MIVSLADQIVHDLRAGVFPGAAFQRDGVANRLQDQTLGLIVDKRWRGAYLLLLLLRETGLVLVWGQRDARLTRRSSRSTCGSWSWSTAQLSGALPGLGPFQDAQGGTLQQRLISPDLPSLLRRTRVACNIGVCVTDGIQSGIDGR
jgi:hypothetical protein